jgi:hypothetical protein
MSLSEKQVFLTLMDKKYNSFRVPPSVGWNWQCISCIALHTHVLAIMTNLNWSWLWS